MKILLTMNLPWFPAVGGANKCNRTLAEGLAARGHQIVAVVAGLALPLRWTLGEVRAALAAQGIAVETNSETGVDTFVSGGVAVHGVADPARLRAVLGECLHAFAPDRVLVSSEDPSQNLLAAALKTTRAPVIYLSHTPAFLPFGPPGVFPGRPCPAAGPGGGDRDGQPVRGGLHPALGRSGGGGLSIPSLWTGAVS
ncbi:MAG TPA: hypothetical protein VGK45_05315 [Thermoanaerobaculia bacterium]